MNAPCDPAFDACFVDEGLFCDPSTNTCKRRTYVGPGEVCAAFDDCRGGASCDPDATGTTRCVPRVRKPRGAICTTAGECASGDACFKGTCSVADPALCR